ncbi:MAG TPA: Wzz/FepE/Etk N-terminal domain-containing protein [Bacteroidia bacterium]|nr:Wzz/FepE/Etk N-terminal domain-containing protein [Bacteroidia bacterium]
MENFNTKEIIAIVLKNKKSIIIVTIIAAIASTVVSYMLKPKFKSFAVVYPVNLSPSSEESNTEQLLQYFNSEEVKNNLAKKFNLFEHYEVDTTSKGSQSLFDLYYKGNVSISPTLYESIEITVKDESPVMARDIVQGIIDETNILIKNLKKERLIEYINNSSKIIVYENRLVDSINVKINDLRTQYNIIDVKSQAKYLSKKIIDGKPLNESEKNLFDGLRNKNVELEKLWNASSGQMKSLADFKWQMDKYLFDYYSDMSYTNIVSKPTLPDKKFFPVRWLIVSISTLSVFALAALFFILSNKSVRKVD